MPLAASIPRSLWRVYLRASQAFPLALIHRTKDNKTQNNTTQDRPQKKNKPTHQKKNGIAAGMVHGIQIRRVFFSFFFAKSWCYFRRIRKMKKKGGQILRVGKEKVILIFDGMLFPIGCANIPHNKQPIEHVLKIPISKPGDRDRPPLYRKVGLWS